MFWSSSENMSRSEIEAVQLERLKWQDPYLRKSADFTKNA